MSEEYEIEITEVMGSKQVAVKGVKHLGETEELRESIEKYSDAVIQLDKISEEYEGIERWWESGKVITEEVDSKDDGSQLRELLEYCPTIEYKHRRTFQRWRNFYLLFPEKGYDSKFSETFYRELCSNKPTEKTREAYDILRDADKEPHRSVISAWRKTEKNNIDSKTEISRIFIRKALKESKKFTEEDLKYFTELCLELNGLEPKIQDNEVQNIIDEVKEELRDA